MRMRKILAATALGAGFWVVPGSVLADTTVQNQNSSESSYARSGGAYAVNSSSTQSGPQAQSGFGNAQAQQNGDNSTNVEQSSSAKSGDAVAGSQVTGSAGGAKGKTTIQSQNNAKNSAAVTGPGVAVNHSKVQAGPKAQSLFGTAQAGQNGSNHTAVAQDATAESGDAVSGSQVTGVVGF